MYEKLMFTTEVRDNNLQHISNFFQHVSQFGQVQIKLETLVGKFHISGWRS